MNEIIKKEDLNIKDMIYEIGGVEVMLDSDLAKLYQVETKRINEAVKNNPRKFPERFSWILSNNEVKNLWSKFSTANISSKSRSNPRVFTEQGIYMLGTILKSNVATDVSIAIMDTFVKMRHYINYTKNILPYKFLVLEEKVDNNTKKIEELFDKFNPRDIVKDYIFYNDNFYDAYSVLMDILNNAKKEIIITDNYAGKELLDILKNLKIKIIIITKNIDDVLKKKYESQYSNVRFVQDDKIHDRFIIVDRKDVYLCGSSLKDVGKKCFAISKMNDKNILKDFLKYILDNI